MQENTLTLSVDAANNSTPANEVYRRFEESAGRSLYIGSDHTNRVRNTLLLTRTMPKANGTFNGVGKTSFKFTQDVSVPTLNPDVDVTTPAIVEVLLSLPVGTTAAAAKHFRQRAVALLDNDAIISTLHELQEV